jgi:hypothetical protein
VWNLSFSIPLTSITVRPPVKLTKARRPLSQLYKELMAETAKTQSQSKAPCAALETNPGQGNVNRQLAKYKKL